MLFTLLLIFLAREQWERMKEERTVLSWEEGLSVLATLDRLAKERMFKEMKIHQRASRPTCEQNIKPHSVKPVPASFNTSCFSQSRLHI